LPLWKGQVSGIGRQAGAALKAAGCQTTLFSFLSVGALSIPVKE